MEGQVGATTNAQATGVGIVGFERGRRNGFVRLKYPIKSCVYTIL